MTAYIVAGTQAPEPDQNQINVMKLSNITKAKDDMSDSEDEDTDDSPVQFLPSHGCRKPCRQFMSIKTIKLLDILLYYA